MFGGNCASSPLLSDSEFCSMLTRFPQLSNRSRNNEHSGEIGRGTGSLQVKQGGGGFQG